MALEVKITVVQAANKESITISDNGTNWGVDGNINTGDVTSIVARVFKRNSTSADFEVEFTAQERADFLTGSGATLSFSDSRWFNQTNAPDDFYTVQLLINDTYESDSGYFSLILELQRLVDKNTITVQVSPRGIAESQPIVASNISLDSLERLDESTDPDRKYRWGLLYDFTYANITKFF